MSKKKTNPRIIADNRKARADYHLEQYIEAGLVLEGWEVKSIRAGQVQLRDSYVTLIRGEAWLIGARITPLLTASTHIHPEPDRSRKLLLQKAQLSKIFRFIQPQGHTVVPVNLHWHKNNVKVEIALAKGKQTVDKRQTIKQREWDRQKQRILKR